jgi:hypothetical protein
MEYETALTKSWIELKGLLTDKKYPVRFLADEYEVDTETGKVLSLSCNTPAQPFVAILVLHYLKQVLIGLPPVSGRWIAFQELVGGQGYYQAFKKRVLKRIERKYGQTPDALLESAMRFKGEKSDLADVAVKIEPFDGAHVLLEIWRGDDEFGPSVDMLFDKSIENMLCTEDVVVMSEFIASQI